MKIFFYVLCQRNVTLATTCNNIFHFLLRISSWIHRLHHHVLRYDSLFAIFQHWRASGMKEDISKQMKGKIFQLPKRSNKAKYSDLLSFNIFVVCVRVLFWKIYDSNINDAFVAFWKLKGAFLCFEEGIAMKITRLFLHNCLMYFTVLSLLLHPLRSRF